MKPSEVIFGAICLIRDHGLNKGDYGDTTRGFCTIGALDTAAGWRDPEREYDNEAYRSAKEFVAKAAGVVTWGVAAWSDAVDTTRDIVLATLITARERALRAEAAE